VVLVLLDLTVAFDTIDTYYLIGQCTGITNAVHWTGVYLSLLTEASL